MSWFYLIPVTGFLGSFHCAAMCGPFIGYFTVGNRSRDRLSHVFYQVGRLLAYLSLGTVAGLLGQGIFYVGSFLNMQRVIMVLMGIALILTGFSYLLPRRTRLPGIFRRQIGGYVSAVVRSQKGPLGAGVIGLLSTLLPCGFLYSFALAAGASGSPVKAVAVMFGFWLGTAPMLIGIGFFIKKLSQPMRQRFQRMVPFFLILFGILAIMGKWMAIPIQGPDGPLCH